MYGSRTTRFIDGRQHLDHRGRRTPRQVLVGHGYGTDSLR